MSTSADADTINAASTDSAPRMNPSLNEPVSLLRGIQQEKDGEVTWHDLAVVRELTGADEEALDQVSKKKNLSYTEYMDAILKKAVISIGQLDVQAHPKVLDKLILADRNILFLAIVKATYGRTRTVRAVCTACETSNDIDIELDEDFKIEVPDFDLRVPIEVNTHKGTFKVRLPNGEDLIESQKEGKTSTETNSHILARTLVFDENEPADKLEFAKNLNVGVRRDLINALLDVQAGPDLEGVDTQCASCGEELPILLDWVSLLLS